MCFAWNELPECQSVAERQEVCNLTANHPDAVIQETDSYEYPKEGIVLFKIR